MSIQNELDKIKNAVYGREVRGAIHDGIKKAYDDASVEKDNANMEVKMARGESDTLGLRLDSMSAYDRKLFSDLMINRKSTTDLENNKMDKNTRDIKVSQINKNKGKIDQTYLSEELLKQISGTAEINATPAEMSVTTNKMALDSITPNRTNFIEPVGKNKWDGTYVNGMAIDASREVIESTLPNDSWGVIVPIEKGVEYTATIYNGGNRDKYALLDEYPSLDKLPLTPLKSGEAPITTFTNDVNANYLFLYIGLEPDKVPKVQVEESSKSTTYEKPLINFKNGLLQGKAYVPYHLGSTSFININTKDKNISINKGFDIIYGNQLYKTKEQTLEISGLTDYHYLTFNLENNNFNLMSNNKWIGTHKDVYVGALSFSEIADEINVYGLDAYNINGVFYSDRNNVEIGKLVTVTTLSTGINFNERDKTLEITDGVYLVSPTSSFKVGAQTAKAYVGDKNNIFYDLTADEIKLRPIVDLPDLRTNLRYIYLGSVVFYTQTPGVYVEGIDNYTVNGKYPKNKTGENESKPKLHGDFTSFYKTDKLKDMSNTSDDKMTDTDSERVYGIYDDLLAANPLTMTKKLLGYGSDSAGVEDESLPIYEYTINNPQNGTRTLADNSPKILIVTGTHGVEKASTWGTLEAMKQLLNNWRENDNLASLKSNVSFKIIPLLNPGGFNDNSRENRHGVDINRNLAFNWEVSGSGTEVYSEPESKVIRDWIAENNDADVFVDYHNTSEFYNSGYISTFDQDLKDTYSSLMRRLTVNWKDSYDQFDDNLSYGWTTSTAVPTLNCEAYHTNGIDYSCTLEIAWDYKGIMFNDVVIERATELIINYLLAVVNLINS